MTEITEPVKAPRRKKSSTKALAVSEALPVPARKTDLSELVKLPETIDRKTELVLLRDHLRRALEATEKRLEIVGEREVAAILQDARQRLLDAGKTPEQVAAILGDGKPKKQAVMGKRASAEADFVDPVTGKPFARRGSWRKKVDMLLKAGFSFGELCFDRSRESELLKLYGKDVQSREEVAQGSLI